jgi:hypothetical protein
LLAAPTSTTGSSVPCCCLLAAFICTGHKSDRRRICEPLTVSYGGGRHRVTVASPWIATRVLGGRHL